MNKNDRKKVLLIDDDEKILTMTREILEMDGHEVVTHNKGYGTTNKVFKEKPDLVLLDINMPFLSGDQITDILKEDIETSNYPVVFYSSNDEDSLREMAKRHGARGYICKGDLIRLRREVKRYLNDN